jgi:hypothetical protein
MTRLVLYIEGGQCLLRGRTQPYIKARFIIQWLMYIISAEPTACKTKNIAMSQGGKEHPTYSNAKEGQLVWSR